MLTTRDWKSQSFQSTPAQYFHAFLMLNAENFCMTPVGLSSEDRQIIPSDSENTEWVYPEQEIIRLLVDKFMQVSQVKSICAQFGSEGVAIWTILKAYDQDARSRIHGKELEICNELSVYDFDFRVTSADLVSPEELIGAGFWEIYKQLQPND